jgi:hypothetical protein
MFDLLRQLLDSSDKSAERREREYETLRQLAIDIRQAITVLANQIENVEDDVDKVKDNTNPRIVLPRFDDQRNGKVANASGPFAITKDFVKMPTSWVGWVLTLAVPTVLGGLGMRLIQWLVNKK